MLGALASSNRDQVATVTVVYHHRDYVLILPTDFAPSKHPVQWVRAQGSEVYGTVFMGTHTHTRHYSNY